MTTQQDSFLPEGYEAPKSGQNYFKLEKGENRFRILSKPILGWIDWAQLDDGSRRPLRYRMKDKPSKPFDPKKPVRHFWAMLIWNYKLDCIQIMEITQATIQESISSLSADPDWGKPFDYDIKIIRTGEGLETSYTVNPVPHKPISKEINEAIIAKGNINLDKLYDGGDPFEAVVTEAKEKSDLPF